MKKIIALLLVIALTAALSVSLTLAYLNDTDEDVNVMTLGNVYIEQHEYQRAVNADGSYKVGEVGENDSYLLETFAQGKPLYPIVGDPSSPEGYEYAGYDTTHVYMSQVDSYGYMDVFAGKNAQDKFVTVENTGKSAAYVRTLVALEIGTADPELLGTSYHKTWTKNYIGEIEVDNNKYSLYEYVYAGCQLSDGSWRHGNGVLPAGQTTYPSLSQVYLGADATNEDVAKLDGNNNGTFDILVLSQAVQAEGFESAEKALDAAFGDITTANHPWVNGVEIPTVTNVSTAEELTKAFATGGVVVLTEDIEVSESINVSGNVTLTLNGNDLDASALTGNRPFHMTEGASLTINGGEGIVKVGGHGLVNVPSDVRNASITLNGGTYTGTTVNGALIRLREGNEKVDVVLNNVNYTDNSEQGYIVSTNGFEGNGSIIVNGGKYSANYGFQLFIDAQLTNVNINTKGSAVEAAAEVTVDRCTINVDPGVTVVNAPGSGIAVSYGGFATVKNSSISGTMAAAYYVYSTGGTIIADNTTANGTYTLREARNDANSNGKIVVNGVTVA